MSGSWINSGSYLANPELSAEMRMQNSGEYVFRQFVEVKDGLGANAGDEVDFTKQLNIDVSGTTLDENQVMPKNKIKFVKDSITVTEYGNGVNYTQKIETLSQWSQKDRYAKGLTEDQKNTIDGEIASKFKQAEIKLVCTSTLVNVATTNGIATATASNNPSDKNIRSAVSYMKNARIPKLGTHYIGIFSVSALEGIYDYLQAIAQYAEPSFRYSDEVGRYYSVRFIEDNMQLDSTAGTSSFGEGVMFGAEAVAEAVALPEELRYEETDVGRSKTLAWYAILGWKKQWSLANDDSNSTGKGIERIVHFTSA